MPQKMACKIYTHVTAHTAIYYLELGQSMLPKGVQGNLEAYLSINIYTQHSL